MSRILILLLFSIQAYSQTCNVCGSVNLDGSSYPSGLTYLWTCSDGQTSTLQSPTLTVTQDMTCTLLVTHPSGCQSVSNTSVINDCDCECNNPCTNPTFNATTECVTINSIGSSCSTPTTDVIQWKDIYGTFQNYTAPLCGCNVYDYLTVNPTVQVVGSNFRLGANAITRCSGRCLSRVDFVYASGSNVVSFPTCSQTVEYTDITASDFVTKGSSMTAYYRSDTPYGTVVSIVTYTYNGNGLNAGNITTAIVKQGKLYKNIVSKRTVTYSDGCPSVVCETELDLPQSPDECIIDGFINSVNLGSPCSAPGYSAVSINAVAPLTYQWYLGGGILLSETSQTICLTFKPYGEYCVNVQDATGCSYEACKIHQAPCTLSATIAQSGSVLFATISNCIGTPTYQWGRYNGSAWTNVGTNSPAYTVGSLTGFFRVVVTCGACSTIAYKEVLAPCTTSVTITNNGSYLTANATACGGQPIIYEWYIQNGAIWDLVQSTTSFLTSNNYTPLTDGLYRIKIKCGLCEAISQYLWGPPDPCIGFSASITGTFTGLCIGNSYTYNRTISGGTAPYINQWKIDGVTLGAGTSFTHTFTVGGTYTLSVQITDSNGCVYNDYEYVTVGLCCGIDLAISPTSFSVCLNQTQSYTTSVTGGTGPFNYLWTSQRAGYPQVSQGTGSTKTVSFSETGDYLIRSTVTDANGCTDIAQSVLSVINCPTCTCVPTLALSGCVLQLNFAGANCSSYIYELEYSLTGSSFSTITTGTASNTTYTPTANGFYRMRITRPGCDIEITNIIAVNCYMVPCASNPTLTFNGTSQTVCGLSTVTVPSNTFGGSATVAYLTDTGAGSVIPSSASTSPFSWQYIPGLSDLNTTVTISGFTDNPLGGSCNSANDTYNISYVANPNPVITSSSANLNVCDSRTITYTPAGGTLTLVSGPATLVGNILTATGTGPIVINYYVNVAGCFSDVDQTITGVGSAPVYTFTVDPVAPAPEAYIFDRDLSSDPYFEDLVTSCAPNDGYIMGGGGNSWDFTVTASNNITWTYSHYEPTIASNLFEVSRTSNSIRFTLKGAFITCGCGAVPPVTPVCGVSIVNAMMRLTGTSPCGTVVYDRIFLKYINN